MTKDAGSTFPSTPHKAKFPDQSGNVVERKVTRPDVLSFCFDTSNLIDPHNHSMQCLLALERFWKTPNPWFWTSSTIIGRSVINAWKGLKHRMPHLHGKMTVEEFADRLAHDCCHSGFQKSVTSTAQAGIAAVSVSRHQSELPSVLLRPVASLTESLHDVTVQCCGGISSTSPFAVDSSNVFSFGQSHNVPQSSEHDALKQRAKDATANGPREGVLCVARTLGMSAAMGPVKPPGATATGLNVLAFQCVRQGPK